MLFSIHSDNGNPSSVNIKQHRGRSYGLSWKSCQRGSSKLNLPDHSPIPAKLDSSPHAHTQVLKVNQSTLRLLLLNKNVIGQKAQVHVKFSNYDNHELPHHRRSSKSNKESSSVEIVSLDEEEEFTSFQDEYEPKIDEKTHFELKGQFLKELRDNTFSGSDNDDANEHIEKGLDVPTRQILDSKGVIPSMKAADAKKAIQDMADHS
ncbi:hypothetical protein Tco_0725277 [Tanacetum coccineum]|uniref:Uncharacterized protein n=1 Tax=Tanacetum coccineum TaxID=301880 RepID=A0ABQ4YDE4_9ASTR